jgi:tight adherence protein C
MNDEFMVIIGATAVMAAVVMGWWAVTGARSRPVGDDEADLRLRSLSDPTSGRVLGPAVRWVGERLTQWSPRRRLVTWQRRIDRAGLAGSWNPATLLGARLMAALTLGAVFAVRFALGPSSGRAVTLAGAAVLGWLLPDVWLVRRGERRRVEMQQAVADTIDQLAVLVRAGLGVDAALARCANSDGGPLGRELARVVQELRLGASRQQALTDMVERTGVDDLRAVVTALTQAEQLGVPVSDTLRIQADEVRARRRQRAAEHAQKLPVKILLPLVVCIFPVLLIVLLGPAVLTVIDELGR